MPKAMTRNLLRAALLASLAMPATALLPATVPIAATQAKAAGLLAEHRKVLEQYGTFQSHGKYGEVWVPTVTPQGWHPYPPCNWVYTKHGWHYDDKTPWGQIVHHHGRWAHDGGIWVWVPGEEYSPGWVIWKASQDWVGWAPTPPEQDMKTLDVNAFNSDKMWIFMDAKKFGKSCDDGIAPVAQVPMLIRDTQYIRDVAVVDGMVVFVFPDWLIGPIVDVDIFNINVWSPIFIVNVINIWNIVWNVNIVVIACPQVQPAMSPPTPPSNPTPPPPPKRADNPPPTTPPGGNTPPRLPPVTWNPPTNPPGGTTPPSFNPPGGRLPPTTWNPPSFPPGGGNNTPPRRPGTGPNDPKKPNVIVDTFPPRIPPRLPGGNGNTGNGGTANGNIGKFKPIDPGFNRTRIPTGSNLSTGVSGRLGQSFSSGGGGGNKFVGGRTSTRLR